MLSIDPLATRYWYNCSDTERTPAAHGFKSLRAPSRFRLLEAVHALRYCLLPFLFLVKRMIIKRSSVRMSKMSRVAE